MNEKLNLLPDLPGSYQMLDKNGVVIYVGKAKNLKKRVKSYFKGTVVGKTLMLVNEIDDFTFITTSSELEAFILELNLIKKYNPKYNILLKDDKSYPYIEYTKNPYPMLKVSRYLKIKKSDRKTIFGPFPNAYAARRIVNLLNRLYPLKKCDVMPKDVCLYYHINECLGYCSKKNLSVDSVDELEKDILSFLRGNDKLIKDKIIDKMNFYSEQLNFEVALELKNELSYIEVIMKKQKVELNDLVNRDVIAYYTSNGNLCVQIFFIRHGKIVGSSNNIMYLISDELDSVTSYLISYYQTHEIPAELMLHFNLSNDLLSGILSVPIVVPLKGKKKNLTDMAYQNAKITLEHEVELLNRRNEKTTLANDRLSQILGINIKRIDAFDNSNLFGTYSVSGMVVFVDGKPNKNEYRKYKIAVDKNDDYNMMREVIYRRYNKVLVENLSLPDLIIVDGGVNQINAAKSVLDEFSLDIKVVGLKKDDKHNTSQLIDGDSYKKIDLLGDVNVFMYLTRIQDEVHRFTINYHKQIRSKGSISSVLDNVAGIGNVRKRDLIKKYGSIKKMKEVSIEEFASILPLNVATDLFNFLKEWHKSEK